MFPHWEPEVKRKGLDTSLNWSFDRNAFTAFRADECLDHLEARKRVECSAVWAARAEICWDANSTRRLAARSIGTLSTTRSDELQTRSATSPRSCTIRQPSQS